MVARHSWIGTTSVSANRESNQRVGKRFNNEVYYGLSQGLLNSRMLELISSSNRLGDIVVAPSFLIKDMWDGIPQSDQTRNFNFFFGLAMTNLGEPTEGAQQQCNSRWNITAENLDAELERTDSNNISFYFILRWLNNDHRKLQNKKVPKGSLLGCLVDESQPLANLEKVDELLAMCYIQYLESTQFLSVN